MIGSALLASGARQLIAADIPNGTQDARRLMAAALDVEPGRLTLVLPDAVSTQHAARFKQMIAARLRRVPVSHLVGGRDFFGRRFRVTGDVLDPRPETEILILEALKTPFGTLLDLGSGSGCILLTLLSEQPASSGMGTDLSPAALDIAQANAQALNLHDRAQFVQSDWFDQVTGQFDLIVSNPPYIAISEMADLAPEVRDHEPRMALTDEADGLNAYRVITAMAKNHLTPKGWLMVEIGPQQGRAVSDLFAQAGLSDIAVVLDMDGRDRVVKGRHI